MPSLFDLLSESDRFLTHLGGCATCPQKLIDFVPATLRPAKLIIVGEAPGAEEVVAQEGFVGKSGQVLRQALKGVGITEFALSNTVHCRPEGNKDPPPKAISCCMNQHVTSEVRPYPLVVLTGNVAINAFFPGQGSQVRGNLAYHPDFPNSRFFSILHPAAIGYDPKRKDEFYQQIDRLGRIYRGGEKTFKSVTGAEFRQKFPQFLKEVKILSLDIETSRLESWLPGDIKSMACCGVPGDEVYAIDPSDPFWRESIRLVGEYLQDPEKQVLGQNIGFDLVWFEKELGIKCNLKHIHDIQGLYYQLHQKRQLGLKRLVAEELDGYRHLVVWPHLEKNVEHLKMYNAEDVFFPQQLFLKDFPRLRPKTRDLYLRVLGPASLSSRRITHAGIYFKDDNWEKVNQEYNELREAEIAAWAAESPQFDPKKYITEKGFKDLDKYIYGVRGYPVRQTTEKSEKPSTDEEAIKELIREGAKELEHCLNIKGIDKRRSTYLKPFPKLVAPDHRIHSNYHDTTTSTGRKSSSEPNMQNNPRNDPKRKYQIRHCFGAAPGNKFGGGDFAQIEFRIAMCLAQDPGGIQLFLDGRDPHMETALEVVTNPTKEDRFKSKSANFSLIYGGSVYGLQQYALNEFGIVLSDSEADKWYNGFFRKYPLLSPWHQSEKQKLRENKGYVESAVGHVWYFPDWDHKDHETRAHTERSAINLTCQGPAAYFMTYLIILVQQEFWKQGIRAHGLGHAEVVLTVHDSIAWEVIPEQVDQSMAIVNSCLHQVEDWVKDWFKVPLKLDTEVGDTWDAA